MDISKEELKEILHEAMEEKRKEFWIEAEGHYLDHKQFTMCRENWEEMRANHEWTKDVRESVDKVKEVGLTTAVRLLIAAAIAALAVKFGWNWLIK